MAIWKELPALEKVTEPPQALMEGAIFAGGLFVLWLLLRQAGDPFAHERENN
jgi:hypothetical protein